MQLVVSKKLQHKSYKNSVQKILNSISDIYRFLDDRLSASRPEKGSSIGSLKIVNIINSLHQWK